MKIFYTIFILVLLFFFYIFFISEYFLFKNNLIIKSNNIEKSNNINVLIKNYKKSTIINPINWKAYFQISEFLYQYCIINNDLKILKTILPILNKIKKINKFHWESDFLIFKIEKTLSNNLNLIDQILKLNSKYPNNIEIQYELINTILDFYNTKYKNILIQTANKLLKEPHFQDKSELMLDIANKTNDFEIIKEIILNNPWLLENIKSILNNSTIEIDYYWLNQLINFKPLTYNNNNDFVLDWINKYDKISNVVYQSQLNGINFDKNNNIINGNMFWGGEISAVLNIVKPKGEILIAAYGTDSNGSFPYLSIYLSNKFINGCFVKMKKIYSFDYQTNLIGNNIITLVFENDYSDLTNKTDRNLYINSVEIK